ncbi:hypothetical protein [Paracoccus sp. MKU1]|uniref:hypothetical protein n=1 Tax=Paracoccus sp. MKU1 TaxID=1745182 RepID=UPI00071911A2|nr:hypothetical protein [Paracoccus sp. MKU1]KRW94302.1 hypothetical protein AQY21_20445 [Paracoccus sp. MKU1]
MRAYFRYLTFPFLGALLGLMLALALPTEGRAYAPLEREFTAPVLYVEVEVTAPILAPDPDLTARCMDKGTRLQDASYRSREAVPDPARIYGLVSPFSRWS